MATIGKADQPYETAQPEKKGVASKVFAQKDQKKRHRDTLGRKLARLKAYMVSGRKESKTLWKAGILSQNEREDRKKTSID